jgi:peptidyl-prolyl cis-trans isomerase D
MSRSLVGSFKTLVMAILVGLLLISLAIWGVSDAFTPNSSDAAAMVGKEKIKLTEFDNRFRQRLRDENQQRPERITTKQAHALGLHQDVVAQLITRKLLKLDADDLGLDVNSRDALEFVESIGAFNNEITGEFDQRKLREILARQNNNMTVKEFEQQVYEDIRIDQSLASLLAGIVAPQDYGAQQYKFLTEQRKVKLLTLDRSAVVTPADPTDEELKAYVDANPTPYIAPEYRRFTLIRVEQNDLIADVEVTEKEVADLFDYKIKTGKLGTVETRSLSQYIANDEETANLITAALSSGEDVSALLTENSIDAPLVYTDVLENATTDPAAGEAAFKMAAGESKTVKGSFGTWYSVLVTGITPANIPDIEIERPTLEEEIKQTNAERIVYEKYDAIQASLDEGGTLEEAATKNEVSVASYDFISRLGETESGDRMEGLGNFAGVASDDKILTEIFTGEPGFEGDVIDTDKDGFAAIRVDEVKLSAPKPFDDIKDLALERWHLEKADEALGELSDALAQRVNDGENLEDIANDIGTGATASEIIMMRAARSDGISGQLAVRLFDGRQGQTIRGTATNGLDRVIAQIDEIIPNADILMGGTADNFNQQVLTLINEDIQSAYRQALMQEYPARAMEENIARVLGVSDQ